MGCWLMGILWVSSGVAWADATSRPASMALSRPTSLGGKANKPSLPVAQQATLASLQADLARWEKQEDTLYQAYLRRLWGQQRKSLSSFVVDGWMAPETLTAHRALEAFWSNKAFYAFLQKARPLVASDAILSARMDVWLTRVGLFHRSAEVSRLRQKVAGFEQQLLQQVRSYRAVIRGKSYALSGLESLLKSSKDRVLREEAWRAVAGLGYTLLKHGFMKMLLWRNVYSYRMGFATFFHRAYALTKLNMNAIFLEYKAFYKKTSKEKKAALKAMKALLGRKKLKPWDHAYALSKLRFGGQEQALFPSDRAQAAVARAFREMGGGDLLRKMRVVVHVGHDVATQGALFDQGKDGWAAWLASAAFGEETYKTWMRLGGRLLAQQSLKAYPRTFQRGDVRSFVNEVLPELFALLVDTPAFTEQYGALSPQKWAQYRDHQKSVKGLRLYLLRTRYGLIDFEWKLYTNVGIADPSPLYWGGNKKFVGLSFSKPLPTWGAKLSLLKRVKQQDAMLGQMIAAHLLEAYRRVYPKSPILGDPRFIPWLRRTWLKPAPWVSFEERFSKATGQRLIMSKPLMRYLRDVWR
ncbi:MAG: hypothetical protein H6728_04300 [Myxococcales bacterium]|nr:hypothetical protein [Myxococcales bacterium]MCB9642273.1 hypothetical protein [Myxococcales bacterium]